MIQSSPMQEAFWHRFTHNNEVQVYEDEESPVRSLLQKLLEDDFNLFENAHSSGESLEQESEDSAFRKYQRRAEELEQQSADNALKRYQIAFEHASQYGEIISFEYDDKKGSSTVVYKNKAD